jgi:HD superfamily phosphodiesterase
MSASKSEELWAEQTTRRLLEPLGARWRHTLGVAECARIVGGGLELDEADVLVAAAFLHDVGYAPDLAQTGFHSVDGARFVRSCGRERLAGLVAYHSGAAAEAYERGLAAELADFDDERSTVSQALTYCDLTTDSEGRHVEPVERLADIRRRYGQTAPETRALERSEVALMNDVRAIEVLLAGHGVEAAALRARAVRSRR